MNLITRIVLLVVFLRTCLGTLPTVGQDSRNGYWLPVRDTTRILLVFAEVAGDPDEPGTVQGWKPGEMPPDPGYFFDCDISADSRIRGMMTKYFYEASFGRFIVLGDYYPSLVTIDRDTLKGDGFGQVVAFLDATGGDDVVTAHDYSLQHGDFDYFTSGSGHGQPKAQQPDNKTDMILVLWRVNSHITRTSSAGYCVPAEYRRRLKNASGFNAFSCFVIKGGRNYSGMRHEFSHTLMGGNNFHTAGAGAGLKTFMSSAGGYALLSSWEHYSPVYNAFDRRRLGWKPAGNRYAISCRNPEDMTEVDGDLRYGQDFLHGNEFVLRDFVTTGDAIRIAFPYLNEPDSQGKVRNAGTRVKQQWLWLENHQMADGFIDHNPRMPKGIYGYIQVGKESMEGRNCYAGNCNYTWPLSAFGNYDFTVDTATKAIGVDPQLENPLTGYNFLIRGAYDFKPADGMIYRDELFLPEKAFRIRNGRKEDGVIVDHHPLFGSKFDGFLPGSKIGIGGNPAAVPVLTYRTSSSPRAQPGDPAPYDNRRIPLNGLSVEVLEQWDDGAVLIRVRWDDYRVERDVRWCGDVVLHEKLILGTKHTLRVDRGLTPQRPENPQNFGGHQVFTAPSTLTCLEGSKISLEKGAHLVLQNGSSLVMEQGSDLKLARGARLIVDGTSSLVKKEGVEITGKGKIIYRR